jgi:hypothetical protein
MMEAVCTSETSATLPTYEYVQFKDPGAELTLLFLHECTTETAFISVGGLSE